MCNVHIYTCTCMRRCLTDYREAACRLRLNENNDAMNAFHNAAKSYKKSNPEGVSYVFIARDRTGLMAAVS